MDLQNLKAALQKVSSESGKDFLTLSDSFPVLIREIDFSDASANTRAVEELREFNRIQEGLLATVDAQNTMQQHNAEFLDELQKRNSGLFENFSSRMEMLEKMNELILKIKDESMEMEIISLNAMIVSIKSGKQGQAFSYITSNLKRLSYQLIAQSETLISYERSVQNNIAELKKTVDAVGQLSQSARGVKREAGERIATTVKGIAAALPSLIELAGTVKQPIIKAMECIQMQDIIRQSIDDVLFTLGHLNDLPEDAAIELRLDQIAFNEQLAELSIKLLDRIMGELLRSTQIFRENHTRVNAILTEVEDKRQHFIKTHASHNNFSESLHTFVEMASEEIGELMRVILAFQTSQQRVMSQSQLIQNEMLKMQACFVDFFPIIESLQYVAVAQRIEVARNEAISSIQSTVEYMSDLIGQTNDNVQSAQEQLSQFIESSNREINKFNSLSGGDRAYFEKLEQEKNKVIRDFDRLLDECVSIIHNFVVYSPDFFEHYERIAEKIRNIESLSADMKAVQSELKKVAEQAGRKKQALLKASGLSEWTIKNDRFNEIIHHFTIVSDKQTAGDMGGFHVEGGAESGEITFF